jgi:5-methylcytosine-specific restriction protein A
LTDVGTTPRKALTPTQRLKLFEAHKGSCGLCGALIQAGDKWIVEHITPLGLGGTNALENLAPVHAACANSKTHGSQGDVAKIAKAKRQKIKHLGIERKKAKIKSRGFETSRKEPRIQKAAVPPRAMFKDA